MAQMTKKQLETINAKCKNGFGFNIRSFLERGEKTLVRMITVKEDEKAVEIRLYWVDEVFHRKNDNGVTIPNYTGNVVPQILISIWTKKKEESIWRSYGLGPHHRFSEYPCNKRLMNKLCEVTEHITDDLIRSLLPENQREECMPTNNNSDLIKS